MTSNSSKSFMIVGHGVWALNPEMATMEPVDDQTIALEASDPLLQLSELQQQLVTNASDLSRRPSFAT